jgi:acetyl-CoA/propionyl-CoA carboxylase biotin carboxyl carrier protein
VVRDPDFTAEDRLGVYTTWIESAFAGRLESALDSFVAGPVARRETLTVEIDGKAVQLGLPASIFNALMHGGGAAVEPSTAADTTAPNGHVTAPMGGNLVKWLADDGAELGAGQPVAVLEAMKMETVVSVEESGTFRRGAQVPGTAVARGEVLGTVA